MPPHIELQQKLEILADAAKYDASCASSGAARKDSRGGKGVGSTGGAGICGPLPKKYWKNLPEAPLIADLIAGSGGRVERMLRTEASAPRPAPKNAYLDSLRDRETPQSEPPDV